MKTATIHNLAHIKRDRGYRFQERDPDMEWICQLIMQSGKGISEVLEDVLDVSNNQVHISYGTIAKWLDGKTKRPQNFTLTWVALALGYQKNWLKTEGEV
jgi:hypothetical protein